MIPEEWRPSAAILRRVGLRALRTDAEWLAIYRTVEGMEAHIEEFRRRLHIALAHRGPDADQCGVCSPWIEMRRHAEASLRAIAADPSALGPGGR